MDCFISYLGATRIPHKIDENILQVFRRLFEVGDFDGDDIYWDMCQKDYRYPEFLPVLTDQLWPPMHLRPLKARLTFALYPPKSTTVGLRQDSVRKKLNVFMVVAGKDRFSKDMLEHFLPHLMPLMELFGAAAVHHEKEVLSQMQEILESILQSGLDLSQLRYFPGAKKHMTVLGAFLHGYTKGPYHGLKGPCETGQCKPGTKASETCALWLQTTFQSALRIWIDTLERLGVDLVRYGHQEQALVQLWNSRAGCDHTWQPMHGYCPKCFFLTHPCSLYSHATYFYSVETFDFGPRAADWNFRVSDAIITRDFERDVESRIRALVPDAVGGGDDDKKGNEIIRLALPGAWFDA